MNLTPESFAPLRHRYLPLLDRLAALFADMDQAYGTVADGYGFRCNGCTENCCQTRFYHHTLLEYLYLVEGIRSLNDLTLGEIRQRAMAVNDRMADADRKKDSVRIMCPLNRNGRCMTYAHRPMICRLHGIPHELRRLDGHAVKHPGCDAFFDQCRIHGKTDYIPFDRTPYYRRMAMLEKEMRQLARYTEKIKRTISQIITTIGR